VTRARGTEPRYAERHGGPRAMLGGPYSCPRCGRSGYSRLAGLRHHLCSRHPEVTVRGRSEILDRYRWPGAP
jgi:hypothetical protein